MLRAVVPYLAYFFVTFVGWTSRLHWHGLDRLTQAQKGGPVILAFWHQRQVAFTYSHRDSGFSVLVSNSKDGTLIAETMRLSRIKAVRGSSSRGGRKAARELLAELTAGRGVGVTPDGPKGPARKVKAGVLFLAQQSGRPIVPIANAVSRSWVLKKAWDHYHVPLPFSRIDVTHGEPLRIGPEDDLDAAARELEARMDATTAEADRMAGRRA